MNLGYFAGAYGIPIGPEYYVNQFLYVSLAKIPMEFVRPYVFLPNPPQAYATVHVDKMLVPGQGSANATVTVTDSSGAPVAKATVWSGPVRTRTGAGASQTVTFDQVFTAAGDHTVAVGTQSATATIAAPPVQGFVEAYGLSIGLLVAGLAVGAVVGIILARRGRPPGAAQATMAEE